MNELPTPPPRPADGASSADVREREADAREAALDTREKAIEARESAQLNRDQETQAILDAAEERDEQADERDQQAEVRDKAASLDSFLREADFSSGHRARLSAGVDRVDSKGDRSWAAADRFNLTRGDRAVRARR